MSDNTETKKLDLEGLEGLRGDGEAKWYVVHTYSGHENKVKVNIEKLVENRVVCMRGVCHACMCRSKLTSCCHELICGPVYRKCHDL